MPIKAITFIPNMFEVYAVGIKQKLAERIATAEQLLMLINII